MELNEFQQAWMQQEKRLQESIRTNNILLKEILSRRTEKKASFIRNKALLDIILPIPMLAVILATFEIRNDATFYAGLLIFAFCFLLTYYYAIRHFIHAARIDFSKTAVELKKDLNTMEVYKLKTRKISLLLAPIFIAGIFMFSGMQVFSRAMFPFYILIILVAGITLVISKNFGFKTRIEKLNRDILELEMLETE